MSKNDLRARAEEALEAAGLTQVKIAPIHGGRLWEATGWKDAHFQRVVAVDIRSASSKLAQACKVSLNWPGVQDA